ncbi:MAG TPA: phage portal protein [Planctomicrobium sp.]|nr:phage portal protein [Planctomicrobium sp.]
MFSILRDRFATFRIRTRYQRLIQERLLTLAESPQSVDEETGSWQLVGGGKSAPPESLRTSIRDRARRAVRENPHASNILRLLTAYVTGPGLHLNHQPIVLTDEVPPGAEVLGVMADQIWKEFLGRNQQHYSFQEHARRTWRDGECFLRRFSTFAGLELRFIDPEWIAASPDAPESQGILTARDDVECPIAYLLRSGSETSAPIERVPAGEMLQTRFGVDSNEKRGISLFAPILDALDCYERWMETELLARKLQSSIVLWRKIQGSSQLSDGLAESASTGGAAGGGRRERFSPGTILTTNHGTDIQFLQPNTNFGDAAPLGRMMLLGIAAGAGLPEFMLTADASNANFSSTMIAEGPAVKYFQNEQQFFAREFNRIWRWVMQDAIDRGQLPDNFFERMHLSWSFPSLVNRDRAKERLADVRLIQAGVLSRAEVGRRDGVQPEVMQAERQKEFERVSNDGESPATKS